LHFKANIIIPVKNLSNSKNRLSPILKDEQRQLLVLVMLEDIIRELNTSSLVNNIYILTDDDILLKTASYRNVNVVIQKHGLDINNALKQFLSEPPSEVAEHPIIILPSDLPLVKCETVEEIIKIISCSKPAIVISPAHDNGTNLIALQPNHIINFHYGENSFRNHVFEALKKGLSPLIYDSQDLALDLDTPEDAYQVVSTGSFRKTALYLARIL